jgi:hypothetical protein
MMMLIVLCMNIWCTFHSENLAVELYGDMKDRDTVSLSCGLIS